MCVFAVVCYVRVVSVLVLRVMYVLYPSVCDMFILNLILVSLLSVSVVL